MPRRRRRHFDRRPHGARVRPFQGDGYVSKFVNSGVDAIVDYMTRGYMDSDATVAGNFRLASAGACRPAAKPPHIILILDKSSFDIRNRPASRCPKATAVFRFLRRQGARRLLWKVPGAELAGRIQRALPVLSARSFGRFAYFVTASPPNASNADAGHAGTLRLSGPSSLSGAWCLHERAQLPENHRRAQFFDSKDMRSKGVEPDSYFMTRPHR